NELHTHKCYFSVTRFVPRTKRNFNISLSKELCDWIEKKIEEKVFYNRSHAIEVAVDKLKKEYED
ncbi:MAG: ribbon-helix-helix domain-containing protein, partial [Thermoplasmata archaeon]